MMSDPWGKRHAKRMAELARTIGPARPAVGAFPYTDHQTMAEVMEGATDIERTRGVPQIAYGEG